MVGNIPISINSHQSEEWFWFANLCALCSNFYNTMGCTDFFPFSNTSSSQENRGDKQKEQPLLEDGARRGISIQQQELNGCHTELQLAQRVIATLRDKIRQQDDKIQSLQQGQDFRSRYTVTGAPHELMQRRLNQLRTKIQFWARKLFGKDWESGRVASSIIFDSIDTSGCHDMSEFEKVLDRIICRGSEHQTKSPREVLQDIKVQDAIAAIASHVVVEQAVLNPLASCTRKMQDAMGPGIYKVMSDNDASTGTVINQFQPLLLTHGYEIRDETNSIPGIEHRRAAKIWQAECMKFYNSDEIFGTAEEKTGAIEQRVESVFSAVSLALRPVIEHYQLTLFDWEGCKGILRNAIRDAIQIGRDLSDLHSGLVLMDKTWLGKNHTDENGLISPNLLGSRIEYLPNTTLPEGDRVIKAKLSIVLFPGLLKYGSDDGENWDSWTAWVPARLQLTDMMIEKPPPPPPMMTPEIKRLVPSSSFASGVYEHHTSVGHGSGAAAPSQDDTHMASGDDHGAEYARNERVEVPAVTPTYNNDATNQYEGNLTTLNQIPQGQMPNIFPPAGTAHIRDNGHHVITNSWPPTPAIGGFLYAPAATYTGVHGSSGTTQTKEWQQQWPDGIA